MTDARAGPGTRAAAWRATAAAALAYLVLGLWVYAPVLSHPFTTLPINGGLKKAAPLQLTRWDQSVAVASITRNAHALLTEPWNFFDGFQCYPLPQSYTLGEHMFGAGMLAAGPYLLTRDPVFSFNAVLVLTVMIAGLSMYLLAREFVQSPLAAFVAGLLFALEPARIAGVAHPFAYADLWTPLALLFLHRLFAYGGWTNTLAFAAFASLEILQSLYPLLWTTVLLLCLALYLAGLHRYRLQSLLPQLAGALVILALVAWLVLGPYLETRATWGLLSDRSTLPVDLGSFLGWSALLVLGVLGLADRLRGARPVAGADPRICFLVAGLLLLWIAAGYVRIDALGMELPPLRRILQSVVPGLDAVRGLYTLAQGCNLALAFLAAYGVLALIERTPQLVRVAIVVGLAAWIVARSHANLATWDAATPAADVELLKDSADPMLVLPHPAPNSMLGLADADHLRFASYGPRRSSACYASFPSPLAADIRRLANLLPDAGAADALFALGFRTVLMQMRHMWKPNLKRFDKMLATEAASRERLRLRGENEELRFYDLRSPLPSSSDLAQLAPATSPEGTQVAVASSRAPLDFALTNTGTATFRLPDPIAPSDLLLRWTTPAGVPVAEERVRLLLPLALAPAASQGVRLEASVPADTGEHALTIAFAERPDQVLGRLTVSITPASP